MGFSWKCPFHVFLAALSSTALLSSSYYILKYFGKKKRSKDNDNERFEVEIPIEFQKSKYVNELIFAIGLAITTGQNIKISVNQSIETVVENKGDTGIDFVTETDKNNELYIFSKIREKYPNHKQIGEESSANSNLIPDLTDEPTWIVDPIDGTTNFVHKFPCSCVSIALVVNKESVVAVVYEPFQNELFCAIRGCGSYLNGKRIHVSNAESIRSSLILTEFGYKRESQDLEYAWKVLKTLLLKNVHGIRMIGSAVVDLCYVASGRLDALYAGISGGSWKPWDYAAGVLILSEAGGFISNKNGDNFDLYSETIVASSSKSLSNEIILILNSS